MKITSDLFAAYLKCPTKGWLRAQGETGTGNEYAANTRDPHKPTRRWFVRAVNRVRNAISMGAGI